MIIYSKKVCPAHIKAAIWIKNKQFDANIYPIKLSYANMALAKIFLEYVCEFFLVMLMFFRKYLQYV